MLPQKIHYLNLNDDYESDVYESDVQESDVSESDDSQCESESDFNLVFMNLDIF